MFPATGIVTDRDEVDMGFVISFTEWEEEQDIRYARTREKYVKNSWHWSGPNHQKHLSDMKHWLWLTEQMLGTPSLFLTVAAVCNTYLTSFPCLYHRQAMTLIIWLVGRVVETTNSKHSMSININYTLSLQGISYHEETEENKLGASEHNCN